SFSTGEFGSSRPLATSLLATLAIFALLSTVPLAPGAAACAVTEPSTAANEIPRIFSLFIALTSCAKCLGANELCQAIPAARRMEEQMCAARKHNRGHGRARPPEPP